MLQKARVVGERSNAVLYAALLMTRVNVMFCPRPPAAVVARMLRGTLQYNARVIVGVRTRHARFLSSLLIIGGAAALRWQIACI